jgi:RNA methyltransferase, TrmH family
MISKSHLQLVRSLHQKKFRTEHNKFIAEGPVLVAEALKSDFKIDVIYATRAGQEPLQKLSLPNQTEIVEISDAELQRMSLLKQAHEMLAVIEMKKETALPEKINSLILALDQISDPGNMGTIIRIADWFGIANIICSEDSVDVYNPKVVQATMGSLFRVEVVYTSVSSFISTAKKENADLKVYGTLLSGKNIYHEKLEKKGIIIMGNETRGISEDLQKLINEPLTIPCFHSKKTQSAESLNVAVATAIVCSEFRRREN